MPAMGNDLEIKVSAEATGAEKALDNLSAKLKIVADQLSNALGTKGLQNIANASKQVSENMSGISQQAKSASKSISASVSQIQKPIETVKKSASEIASTFENKYKDLGKNFQFFGSEDAVKKQIEKYSNALENAKLKKEELEKAGTTEGQMYEYAIRDIQKYSNMISVLQEKVGKPISVTGNLSLMSESELEDWFNNLPSIKEQAEQAAESIKESFEQIEKPIKEIDMSLANFSAKATQAFSGPKEKIESTANSLEKLKNITNEIKERFLELKGRLENTFVQKGLKTYSQQYVELQNQITKTEKTLATLNAQMARGRATNAKFESTTTYKKMQYDISQATEKIKQLREEQDKLEVSGSATQWNFPGMSGKITEIQKSMQPLQNTLQKVNKKIDSFIGKLKSLVAPAKSAKKSTDSFSLSNVGLAKSLLKTTKMLKLMILRMALRGIISGVQTGFQNLAQYSDRTNKSMSMLMNSLNQLKNSFAAMVSPIFNAVAPALNSLIQIVIKATNALNQLFSAIVGRSTWTKAKELTDDYASSLTSAGKAAKGSLQSFDELNNLTTQDSSGNGGTSAADMFNEEEIAQKWKDLAEKIKSIAEQLFEPLKKAWDSEGKFVMDSWQSALNEVWNLVKSIGSDFLKVWGEDKTVKIFEDILHIIGDIGIVVSNLAANFRSAWEENETGKQILQGIRDIIGEITSNIRHAADATAEWSNKLDYSPILSKIQEWISSLKPVFDTLSGIITDFYEYVLLPLEKWALEKGLPDLLQVFIDFNNKVDWENLRENLREFWKHLEPFAETVGEGLIIFIGRISDRLADFVNSESFQDFLKSVEDWMDNVDAEDVADNLEKIAKAIILLKIAIVGFKVISTSLTVIDTVAKIFDKLSKLGIARGIKTLALSIGEAVASLGGVSGLLSTDLAIIFGAGTFAEIGVTIGAAIIGGIIAVVAGWNFGQWLNEKITGEEIDMSWTEQFSEIKKSFSDGSWKEALSLWKDDIEENLIALAEDEEKLIQPIKDKFNDFKNLFSDGQFSSAMSLWKEDIGKKLTEVVGKIDNWYTNDVSPWFTKEKWGELWENTKSSASEKWEELVKWWNNSAIVKWWNDSVLPWFTKEKWLELWGNLKISAKEKWDDFKSWWENNALSKWYNEKVKPWFTKDKWTFDGITQGLTSAWNGAIESVKKIWNNFASYLNSKMKYTIPSITIMGETVFSGGVLDLGKIPTFATGGFPEDGLFMANSGELVGEFSNGKTAVANNEQIVDGIRQGVMDAVTSALVPYLSDIAQSSRATAEKEFGITERDIGKSAKNYAKEYFNRTGNEAYSF